MKKVTFIIVSFGILFGIFCVGCFSTQTYAQHAAILREEKKYHEAIVAYEKHIEERSLDQKRPADENPAFYYLLIGDIYLELQDPDKALKSYEQSLAAQISPDLVSYKLRMLAHWYEAQNQLEQAIAHLQRFRESDPVMFDFDIDRLHKKQLSNEDAERKLPESPTVK